jgi:hypothetical protein
MKKHKPKKISLNRETVRQLENGDLRQPAAAQWSPPSPDSCCYPCSVVGCTTG